MKVSVIIPVYNAAGTMLRCLRSVEAQTLRSLEVVVVDDHGSDASMAMAREFAASSGLAWKFIETPGDGHGPGAARNAGIDAAGGEYLAFLDADDSIEPGFCEKLYDCATGGDLVHCDITMVDAAGVARVFRNPSTTDRDEYLKSFVSYFTTYLYRRAFVNGKGIRFPGTHSAEDSCFLICCLLGADRINGIGEALYTAYLEPGSVSRGRNRRRGFERLASFAALRRYVRENGLWDRYGRAVRRLSFRKGLLLAIRDFITG